MGVGVLVVVWPRVRWIDLVGDECDLPILVVYGFAMLVAGGKEPVPGAYNACALRRSCISPARTVVCLCAEGYSAYPAVGKPMFFAAVTSALSEPRGCSSCLDCFYAICGDCYG